MATWSVTVTNKGIALQTKQVNGATISFTRVVSGSGSVSIVNLKEQTAVKSIVQTLSMESLKVLDDTFKITVLLSNAEVTEGYNLSQIGFYATDPDEGEILFAIGQIDTPRAIPTNDDSPGYCLEFAFTFQNSNNVTIEITPDMSAYVTMNVVNDVVENAKDEMTISGAATGNPISIDDSTDAPFNDITIYGASEQIKTTGYQLVDFSAGNNTTGTTSNFENDTLTVSGDGTVPYQNWGKDITALITEHPGEILWFDYGELKTNVSHDGSIVQLNIALNDDTNIYAQLVTISGIQRQYTIPDDTSNIKSVQLCVYTTNNTTAKANTVRIKEPMLQYGTDKKEYEPYTGRKPGPNPDYPQEIESVGDGGSVQIMSSGKNLIPYPYNQSSVSAYGATFIAQEDGGILGSGSATDATGIVLYGGEVLGKNTVTASLSGNFTNMTWQISLYDESDEVVCTYQGENKFTFDISEYPNAKSMRLLVKRKINGEISGVAYPQLEFGNNATYYEQYKVTTAIVPLSNPLCGIPVSSGGNYTDASGQQWICDEIDLARGVYVINCYKETITFSYQEDLGRYSGMLTYNANTLNADGTGIPVLCKTLIYNKNAGSGSPIVNGIRISSASPKYAIAYHNGDVITTADVIYPLATPIETPLTDEQITALQSLQTFEPNTNIFADDLANMDVEYFKNNGNGKAMAILKNENIELRKLIGDVNTVLESLIGGA